MTFAVVGILGHNAKTVLLFFIPQIINFLYSLPQVRPCPAVGLAHTTDRLTVIIHLVHSPPQLFKLVPCPRHRMPGYVATSDCVCTSYAEFNMSELSTAGALVVKTCRALRLAHVELRTDGHVRMSNLTIINYVLWARGPMHEASLTMTLLLIQAACSALALLVRYRVASLFYDVVR